MRRDGGAAIFWLTAASAAATLISIAATEILLAAAFVLWIVWVVKRPARLRWPSYFLPLAAFMATTLLSLAMSPHPGIGWHPVQKVVLFSMGLLTAALVTTETRAENAYKLLLAAASISAFIAVVQFVLKEALYFRTGDLAADPTLVNRITGPLGHWETFSGVQLLVWCAAIPAIAILSRKWIVPVSLISVAIVLSNTRGVWLAAALAFAFVAFALPRRVLAIVLIPALAAALAASPFIYRRIAMSFDKSLETNYSRAVYRNVGLAMIKAHPLFGVGPERIKEAFPEYYKGKPLDYYGHLHNNILQIGAERGLLCLASFFWLLIELYRSLLNLFKNSDENTRWAALGALGALTGFVIHGLTEYNLGDSEVLVLLLFLVSIPFGLATHVQEDPDLQPR